MGSLIMDREAGYQQARVDLLRGDRFAMVNHRHKVLDWNQDKPTWTEGYATYLLEVAESPDSPADTASTAWDCLDASTRPPAVLANA